MKRKVTFELLSDVMAGGIRIADNFLESEKFLSGATIRAAFAYDILLNCPAYDDFNDSCEKKNYIYLRDENNKCKSCKFNSICRNFSDMRFSFAYLEDTVPAPFTARVCKIHGTEHDIKDTLVENGRIRCSECPEKEIGRMENLKGFVTISDGFVKSAKIKNNLSVHTAINYTSGTALDTSLFSVNAIKKGQYFTAYIDDCETGMIYEGKVIYAGKYSSCGFGKMKIVSIENADEYDIEKRISDFNRRFENSFENNTDKIYASLLFISDAKFDFKDDFKEVKTNEEYLEIWQKNIFGENNIVKLEKIFAENKYYAGFDTSAQWGKWHKERPDILTLKGTSALVSYNKSDEKAALDILKEISVNGIGNDTLNGYGQVEICNGIHMKGAASDDK